MSSKNSLSPEELNIFRQSFRRRAENQFAAKEAQRKQAKEAARNAIVLVMRRYPSVRRAYLFGSVVKPGAFKETSDIDVGIEDADMALCFDIWRDLEREASDWRFDVRPLETEDPFSERVRQKGELVYDRSTEIA